MTTRVRLFTPALLLLFAAACGGSSSSTASSSTPSAVSGTITGFGSVIVDQVEYDDSTATVVRDDDPANPTPVTVDALRLGQQVNLSLRDGQCTSAFIEATVIGTIDKGSINPNDTGTTNTVADSFTVLGQTVVFTPSGAGATVFAGITDSTQLADGQIVEVHGTLGTGGTVAATRIEVLPATGTTALRVSGIVANATAKTFTLGTLTVDYSQATLVPSTATISNGEKVFVFANQLPTGTAPNLTLVAKSIRVASAIFASRPLRIGGLVTTVTPVSGQAIPNFTLDGFSVDASKATLNGSATAADLTVNALVVVEGTFSNGVLVATSISITPASSGREVMLSGQVSSYVSQSSFVVRGTTVDATNATFKNGTASQLANGAFVLVRGHLSPAAVVADEVIFENPPANQKFHLDGAVSDYASTASPPTFSLLGISMQLDPSVTFVGGSASDLKDGALVEVTGTFTGTVFDVTEVEFLGVPVPTVYLTGTLSGLTGTSGAPTGFTLNNATVTITASTIIQNGPLSDGQVVEVTGQLDTASGDVVAQRITVLSRDAVQLFGPITAFTSASNFTVDGQTVDASSATFLPSSMSASDLAVGKVVRVDGTLSSGVVKASEVVFLFFQH